MKERQMKGWRNGKTEMEENEETNGEGVEEKIRRGLCYLELFSLPISTSRKSNPGKIWRCMSGRFPRKNTTVKCTTIYY